MAKIPPEIIDVLIKFLLKTPKILALSIFSYLSGHLWMFIILTYFKKGTKGNKILNNMVGRLSLGFCWYALVLIPVYWLFVGDCFLEYENILRVITPTIVFGLAFQLVSFIIISQVKGK